MLNALDLLDTGYKLRNQIARNLSQRTARLRDALKKYNEAAAPVDRPTFDAKQVGPDGSTFWQLLLTSL